MPDDESSPRNGHRTRTGHRQHQDFIPPGAQYRAAGLEHAGLILVSAKTFPQDLNYFSALAALLDEHEQIEASQIAGRCLDIYLRDC
jgi:hypothetical protein